MIGIVYQHAGTKISSKKYNVAHRYTLYLNIEVDWAEIKILSKAHPNIDACSEIPKLVKCPLSAFSETISHHTRWDWTSLKAISITNIAVSFPGYYHLIYHYIADHGPDDLVDF